MRRSFPSDHPVLASSYSGLAAAEWERGNRSKARELHERAFEIRKNVYELDHPVLAGSYSSLAMIERSEGNLERAREFCLQALDIRENVFEPNHPAIASSCAGLASRGKRSRKSGQSERIAGKSYPPLTKSPTAKTIPRWLVTAMPWHYSKCSWAIWT